MKGNLFELKKGKMKKKKDFAEKRSNCLQSKRQKKIDFTGKEVTDKVKDHDNKSLNHWRFNFYAFPS